MTRTIDFTGKTKGELEAFRRNAEDTLANPRLSAQHDRARALLESLPPPAVARRATGPTAPRAATRTSEADELLTALAADMQGRFDLSKPPGTSQPHNLTGKDGRPKVGGRQRAKEVAADRYLSYKRGDRVAVLGWVRRHEDDPVTGGAWYRRPAGWPEDTPDLDGFEAARDSFLAEIAEMAPPRA